MRDFLLELGFEELPARFVDTASRQLGEKIEKMLKQAGLDYAQTRAFGTPRRLAVIVKDLSSKQPDRSEEIKGPPCSIAYDEEGNLTKAGEGFLRSQDVTPEALEVKKFQGSDYLFVQKETKGQITVELLPSLLEEVIKGLNFPKNMRWGGGGLRYARPLRWIVALYGSEVISVQVGNVKGGRNSFGHRQLSPGKVPINAPGEYEQTLEEHYVLVDGQVRRELIWNQVLALSREQEAVVQEDPRLLGEIANLLEYPTAFCGRFAPEYLEVPPEILITTMKEHQRYFPLEDQEGRLIAKFIGLRNGAGNHLENVIAGNERVLAARLADAMFFFAEDCQIPLDEQVARLDGMIFQDGLGSVGEKVERLVRLACLLGDKLGYGAKTEDLSRTARLAKADLVSQMVGEFPELQGIMGEKYALLQSEAESVAQGVREHYLPRFSGDNLPETVEGMVVSLADKSDSLAGYFALGLIPTGSQDPFALRRMAQGIVQILAAKGFGLPLRELISLAAEGYKDITLSEESAQALEEFFLARVRVYLLENGFSYDLVDAVLASGEDRLPNLVAKVRCLAEFRKTAQFSDLLIGLERMSNLAQKGAEDGPQLDQSAFQQADQDFWQALKSLEDKTKRQFKTDSYREILLELARFRGAVDSFFAVAMIMDENLTVRGNRLTLLKRASEVYRLYGDFRLIVDNK